MIKKPIENGRSGGADLPAGRYVCTLMDGRDRFRLDLKPDGTLTYIESVFFGYIGRGSYKAEDGVLHLSCEPFTAAENKAERHYRFGIEGDKLVFLRSASDGFIRAKVPEGAVFVREETFPAPDAA